MKSLMPASRAVAGWRWLAGWGVLVLALSVSAVPAFDTTTPASFFTNVADRVIRAETANWCAENYSSYTNTFGATVTNAFGVANIPVYINGNFVYAPSIQRLLQVTANTFEAMSTNPYPTPALSTQSPFLNETDPLQELYGNTITDAAYEALPSQLLGQLGLASLGTVVFTNGQWVAQFTGQAGNQYVLQSSADLIHWTNPGTNSPVLGVMSLPVAAPSGGGALFYRSQLLP